MPQFNYDQYRSPYVGSISDLIQEPNRARAQAALQVGQAQAQATQAGGQAWGNAIQQIGQIPQQMVQQQQQQQQRATQQEHLAAQTAALKATADEKAQEQADLRALDQALATPGGRNAVIEATPGHLRPKLLKQYEEADTLASNAKKAAAQAKKDQAEYVGFLGAQIKQAGYDPATAIAAIHHAREQYADEPDMLKQIDGMRQAFVEHPDAIKQVADAAILGSSYRTMLEQGRPVEHDPAKELRTATGQLIVPASASPAHEETARHNMEMERIAALSEGRAEAAQRETARHNSVIETQGEAAPNLTPESLRLTAHQFAMTGNLPPMGMGKTGAKVRTDIINEAAKTYAGLDLPSQITAYKANQASLTKLQGTVDKVTAFESTAGKNLDQFLALADKIPDTGVPWINQPIRSLDRRILGSADMAAASAARDVALREIARVTNDPNLTGVISDSARKEISNLSPTDATFAQIRAVAKVLKQDMANVHTGLNEQIGAVQKRIATPPGTQATQQAAPIQRPIPGISGGIAESTDGGKTWIRIK